MLLSIKGTTSASVRDVVVAYRRMGLAYRRMGLATVQPLSRDPKFKCLREVKPV